MHESEIDWLSWKESLNSDGQQFRQSQQIPHTLTHWTQKISRQLPKDIQVLS